MVACIGVAYNFQFYNYFGSNIFSLLTIEDHLTSSISTLPYFLFGLVIGACMNLASNKKIFDPLSVESTNIADQIKLHRFFSVRELCINIGALILFGLMFASSLLPQRLQEFVPFYYMFTILLIWYGAKEILLTRTPLAYASTIVKLSIEIFPVLLILVSVKGTVDARELCTKSTKSITVEFSEQGRPDLTGVSLARSINKGLLVVSDKCSLTLIPWDEIKFARIN